MMFLVLTTKCSFDKEREMHVISTSLTDLQENSKNCQVIWIIEKIVFEYFSEFQLMTWSWKAIEKDHFCWFYHEDMLEFEYSS